VFEILVDVLEYDMPLREAIDAPRFHHAWMPDKITMEKSLLTNEGLLKSLRAMGHATDSTRDQGDRALGMRVDAKTGLRIGVVDRRRDGWAAKQ